MCHMISFSILCVLLHALRSYTVSDPKSSGCPIGVVLYQSAFFVGKANHDISMELLGKAPYPTGGMQIGWDGDVTNAYP